MLTAWLDKAQVFVRVTIYMGTAQTNKGICSALILIGFILIIVVTISSIFLLSTRIGLEIHLLSFISFISNNKNIFTIEASLSINCTSNCLASPNLN